MSDFFRFVIERCCIPCYCNPSNRIPEWIRNKSEYEQGTKKDVCGLSRITLLNNATMPTIKNKKNGPP